METLRTKRMFTLLAMLAATAVFAAGCGDDDDDNGGGGGLGNTTEQTDTGGGSTDVPDNKEEAVDRCFEEADKLEGDAKEQARAVCEAAEKGEVPDVDTDKLKENAKEQCLEAAKQIPEGPSRQQAEDACEKLGD